MFRSITLTIFVLLAAAAVFSQSPAPCDLDLSHAPALRGLKLGMPVAAVGEILGVPVNPKPVSTGASFIKSGGDYVRQDGQPQDPTFITEWYRNSKSLRLGNTYLDIGPNVGTTGLKDSVSKNAGEIRLEFLHDKLESIWVAYNFSDMPWNGKDEFLRHMSAKFDVPQDQWKNVPPVNNVTNPVSELRCRDFVLWVGGGEQGFAYNIVLKDLKAQDEIARLTKQKWLETIAAETEKKKAFVP